MLCEWFAPIALCLAFAGEASAQWGIWGVLEQLKKPIVTARSLRLYSEMLGLRPDQQNAADELLFAYEREQRELSRRFDEVGRSINDEYEYEDDNEVQPWRDVWPKLSRTFRAKANKLNKGVMDDLKALLDQQQSQKWSDVERLQRRQSTLSWGGRAADQIDLADVIKGMRLDETVVTAIAATMHEYELELDRELQARIKYLEDSSETWFKMMEEYDEAKWMKMSKEFAEVNKKVGDVNTRFRRTLESELPSEAGKEFDRRVKQAIYPKIYRTSHTEMVIEAALKMEGLDAATIEGIKGVKEGYERDADAANLKWAEAFEALDERMAKENAQRGGGWWGNWRPYDATVDAARKARREIDKKATAAVRAMLTEEQRKKLPDRKWRPEWDLDGPGSPTPTAK